MNKATSPYIENHSWGQLIIQENDQKKTYKDAKLYPGGSRTWDWNETGTSHEPGIQRADVEELIENGAEVIILSQGVYERLKVCNETTEWLDELGKTYYIQDTKSAIKTYNDLREKEKVGGLFHSTC